MVSEFCVNFFLKVCPAPRLWKKFLLYVLTCNINFFLHLILCCAVLCLVTQSWLLRSMRILQARILKGVAMPSSRRSSQTRDRTQVSRIAVGFFTIWTTKVQKPEVGCRDREEVVIILDVTGQIYEQGELRENAKKCIGCTVIQNYPNLAS